MTKEAFLNELRKNLSGLPQEDIDERISFYSEMIDDRMEDGIPEEDAVAGIGSVESVKEQIMADIPLAKLVVEKVRPKRSLKAWEIVLLVLGAPVWIPLIIAAIAVVFALFVVIWAVVVSVYAVALSLAVAALGCLAGAVFYLVLGNPAGALFAFGAGTVCAGLAILLFLASVQISKAAAKLTGRMLLGIKNSFVGKEV